MKRERIITCRRCGFQVSSLAPHTTDEACKACIASCISGIAKPYQIAEWLYDRYIKRPTRPTPKA